MKDKKRAFQEVWEIAKGKLICQLLEEEEGKEVDPEKKKHNHGGMIISDLRFTIVFLF